MKLSRRIAYSLLLSLLVGIVFSWPLPRYFFDGIPSSSQNVEKGSVRRMIPGDHFQLLYNFWLAGDMLAGRTPFFQNLYEFNTGDDSARREVKAFYAPVSLVYAVAARIGGRAFGWNLTGFLSIWLTYLLTWTLARRYVRDDWIAATASLVSIVLPFRWVNLLGGSPAGFAAFWAPAVLLGLDLAVREDRIAGGLLAGVSLLAARWGDAQLFFYTAMISPLWCALALAARPDFRWNDRRACLRLFRALLPFAVFAWLALHYSTAQNADRANTALAGGRDLAEVAIFSPRFKNLFAWRAEGLSSHVYLGFSILVLLALGGLTSLRNRPAPETSPRHGRAVLAVLLLAIAGIVVLALGTRGPFDGLLPRVLRKLVPPYAMIRQPAKIFGLLPTLLSVAAALSLAPLAAVRRTSAGRAACLLVFAAFVFAECRLQVRPTICLIDRTQRAYATVAIDAAAQRVVPRALVIPLWPGDSSWSAIYEHYVSLYRIRMINGYNPVVRNEYMEGVFRRFKSANQGILTDEQLDDLRSRGITYILLHEDAFPEKVSPFPVGHTLKRLLNHPRLQFLERQEAVWAFSILPSAQPRPEQKREWTSDFPARRWDLDQATQTLCRVVQDDSSQGRYHVAMDADGAALETRPTDFGGTPGLRLLLRARGSGTLQPFVLVGGAPAPRRGIYVNSSGWAWYTIPLDETLPYGTRAFRIARRNGAVDVDTLLLAGGAWASPVAGESIEIPAACLFHAGYTDEDGVILRAASDPEAIALYGPKMPLEPGSYRIEIEVSSPAPAGTKLGRFNLRWREKDDENWTALVAGQPAQAQFEQADNRPVFAALLFERNADLRVEKIVFTRMK